MLYASAGNDALYGGPDHDLVRRNGHRVFFNDYSAAEDMVVGLVDGPQTAAELQTKGSITVSLEGRILTLNGPTGAGFQLEGFWFVQPSGNDVYYWSFGEVKLKTAAGDISLTSVGFTIIGDATSVPGVGKLRSAVLENILPLDTTNVTNPISDAALKAGLTIHMPGMNYGIATGEQIRALDPKAPLADSVPYIYVRGTTGQIEYQGLQYSGLAFTAAIDPTDPAVYIGTDGHHHRPRSPSALRSADNLLIELQYCPMVSPRRGYSATFTCPPPSVCCRSEFRSRSVEKR